MAVNESIALLACVVVRHDRLSRKVFFVGKSNLVEEALATFKEMAGLEPFTDYRVYKKVVPDDGSIDEDYSFEIDHHEPAATDVATAELASFSGTATSEDIKNKGVHGKFTRPW